MGFYMFVIIYNIYIKHHLESTDCFIKSDLPLYIFYDLTEILDHLFGLQDIKGDIISICYSLLNSISYFCISVKKIPSQYQ